METAKTLLVPFDFTIVAEYAFAHAQSLSTVTKQAVKLLHVASKSEDFNAVKSSLSEVAQKLAERYKVDLPEIIVKSGSLGEMITEASVEYNASLVIMGTHGPKGFQKIFGSRALKVIIGSKIPFIVVQDFPIHEKFEKVILPIDYRSESKDKAKWADFLYGAFKNTLIIVHPRFKDKNLKSNIQKNIMFCKKMLDNKGVPYEIQSFEDTRSNAKYLVELAKNSNADLILMNTIKGMTFMDMLLGNDEQSIIANKYKIPVMVVNPKPPILGSGFSATGS